MGTAQEKPAAMNAKRPPQWEAVFLLQCLGGYRLRARSHILIAFLQSERSQRVGGGLLAMAQVLESV